MDIITKENEVLISVKCKGETFYGVIEAEDYDKIKDFELVVVKQHGYATINIYTDKKSRKRKSLGKVILDTDKNVYLKDRYTNSNKYVLNYRKSNLSVSIKDVEGYTELARELFYKNEENILKNRPKKRVYSIDVANKFMVGKTGEDNYRAKLTGNDVDTIREKYALGLSNQEELAREYNVSRSTISSIVTYKRWTDVLDDSKRKFNDSKINTLLKKQSYSFKPLDLDNLDFKSTYHLKNDNLYYYLEDLNDYGLVYIEIRNSKKELLVRGDLLFSDTINKQTKREYSIASKYPVKTPVREFVTYINKLKEYI